MKSIWLALALAASSSFAFRPGGTPAGTASYIATVVADGPIAYWTLGESAGTTATDEMGSYNGTYDGTYTLGAGGITSGGTSLSLATAGGMTVADGAQWDMNSCTWEFWVYSDSWNAPYNEAIAQRVPGDANYFGIRIVSSGKVEYISSYDAQVTQMGSALSTGAWHHVAVIRNTVSQGVSLYIDGAQSGAAIDCNAVTSGVACALQIGRLNEGACAGGTGEGMNGKLQHVAFYNKALTAAQVAAHNTRGTSP